MNLMTRDEFVLINENRYKIFLTSIEKVLKQFENSSEWHDFIPILKKLKKIIETNVEFHSLPKRLTVMKQLSRCLHPALPHGVHLETLSVYETIFQMLDKRNFQRDLLIYSYGLFPLLSVGAYPVKSVLLNLYEKFFLPLGSQLEPILTGFLIGLFSSLEEDIENSQRLNILLENLIHQVDEFYFYTCLWSAMCLVTSVRHAAALFLFNHFDRQQPRQEQKFIKGFDEKTMITAISTCFTQTNQSLAQRTILDFLSIYSPMNEKQFDSIQMKQILQATLALFLQRDASLNRRIYTWFLGRDGDQTYFALHTQEILIETIIDALELVSICQIESSSHSEDERTHFKCQSLSATWTLTKLIQMLLVLIDKSDVGPNIIEFVFHHYLFVVYEQVYYSIRELNPLEVQQEKTAIETMKTFHLLLENLEPFFIWEYLTKIFYSIFDDKMTLFQRMNSSTIEQICGVISMLLEIYNFDSGDEIQSKYLPEMLKNLIEILEENLHEFNAKRLSLSLETLMKITEKIRCKKHRQTTPNGFDHEIHEVLDEMLEEIDDSNDIGSSIIRRYEKFFHKFIFQFLLNENESNCEEKFQRFQSILRHSEQNFTSILNRYEENDEFYLNFHDHVDEFIETFDQSCQLFEKLENVTENVRNYSNDWLVDLSILSICRNGSFAVRRRSLIVLLRHWKSSLVDVLLNQTEFVSYLLADLWQHLKTSSSIDEQRQAAEIIGILHSVLSDDRCDRLISRQLTTIDEFQRFFRLWNFTRETSIDGKPLENSLLVVLNALQTSNHYRLKSIVQQWISHCFSSPNCTLFLSQINQIFRIFHRSTLFRIEKLVDRREIRDENDDFLVPKISDEDFDDENENHSEIFVQVQYNEFFYTKTIDFDQILVCLNIFENFLNLLSSDLTQILFLTNENSRSYLLTLFEFLLGFIRSFPSTNDDNEMNVELQFRSFSFLTRLCHELTSLGETYLLPLDQIHLFLRKISLKKILVQLFNEILHEKTLFIDEFLRLVGQLIRLEDLICSNDADLFYQSLVNQTMFHSFVFQYVKNLRFIEFHHFMFDFLIEILPFAGSTLKSLVIGSINQLNRNIFHFAHVENGKIFFTSRIDRVDYLVTSISYLSYICHYGLGSSTLPSVRRLLLHRPQTLKSSINIRQIVLRKLSLVLSTLFLLWKKRQVEMIRREIRSMILSLLKTNGVALFQSLAFSSAERKRRSSFDRENQTEIPIFIEILIELNDFTVNELIGNLNELIRRSEKREEISLVWSFEFLLAFCEKQPNFSFDCWSKLATMFKECLNQPLSPTVNFLMIRIWSLYVKEAISLIEKRDIRDVQEITMKILENLNSILVSTTRKARPFLSSSSSDETTSSERVDLTVTFSALSILIENGTTLFDIVHKTSEDKDQMIVEFLQRFLKNLLPFVRLRTTTNFVGHRSASILLKNLSELTFARDVVDKKLLEVFFDSNFFQTDLQALKAWRTLLSNLISDEKTTNFKDLMDRLNRVQTSFFSSKENLNELALAMKRTAFLIFVAEKDQCARFLPEILKRIVDLLKLPQTPVLQTQIFLLFRTLAVRLSAKHFATFWPIFLTELIQNFLQLENELLVDLNKETTSDLQRLTTSELNPPTLKVYLFACKFLDVLLTISPSDLFYFQFCRQAFCADRSPSDQFVGIVQRLANLLNEKVQLNPSRTSFSMTTNSFSRPMLRQSNISDITELYPFFSRLSTTNNSTDENSFNEKFDQSKESTIIEDFLDPLL